MSGQLIPVDRERAHACLHSLSQPLTVMSLALTLVQCSTEEVERAQALESVVKECNRAMRSVNQLRALLEESVEPAHLSEPADGKDACESNRTLGGVA